MSRRRSGVQEFLDGFNGVYGAATKTMRDISGAKIAKAELETITGEDGKESYRFLGKDYDTAPTESEQKYARNSAMGESMKKYGDVKGGMQMDMMASQQRNADNEAAFTEKTKEWISGSLQGQANANYQKQMGEWEQQNKEFQAKIQAGANPQELGLPPAKPEAPKLTYLDHLHDQIGFLSMKAGAGKYDPKEWSSAKKEMQSVEDSGAISALKRLDAGDLDGAIADFTKSGAMKFSREDVVSYGPTTIDVNGTPIKTHELVIKTPDGSTQTINAFSQLDGYGKAQEMFSRTMSGLQNKRSDASLGLQYASAARSAQTHAQGQSDRTKKEAAEAAQKEAGMGLFKEQNPDATPAQIAAAQHGVIPYVGKGEKESYDVMDGNIRNNFSTPATDEDGSPVYDPMTGQQRFNRDPEAEAAFEKWAADKGFTSAKEAYVKYQQHLRKEQKERAAQREGNKPRNEQDARNAAIQAIENGASLEDVNEKLKKAGFPPLIKM